MLYMLLLYNSFGPGEPDDAEYAAIMRDHTSLVEDLKKHDKYKLSHPLEGVRSATTVRIRSGKTLVSDGPFAETKESLGGFYLVEAKNLDDAISIAQRLPDARFGSVEVRPVSAGRKLPA
jgi:hypothetical protein